MAHNTNHSMAECITNCTDCHRICLETITRCLTTGGNHAEVKHLQLLMDCVASCNACTNSMIRGSEHHAHFCGLCEKICTACAESCEKTGDKACAEACRKCAESCGAMAKSMEKEMA